MSARRRGWRILTSSARTAPSLPLLEPGPIAASLQLARLTYRANRFPQDPIDLSRPVEEDRQQPNTGSHLQGSSAAQGSPSWYYLEALKEDTWLWEAWTGLCDFGSSYMTFSTLVGACAADRSR